MPTKKDNSKSHVNIKERGDDTFSATYHDSKGRATKTVTRHMAADNGWGDYKRKGATNVAKTGSNVKEPSGRGKKK